MIQLPKKWIDYLVDQPESGMGYHMADIVMDDGTVWPAQTILNCGQLLPSNRVPMREDGTLHVFDPNKIKEIRVDPNWVSVDFFKEVE